ncbi:hypothetical protein [Sporosarcina sp. Marseille-Q4943]|uniref:hypothetical protein n=1 Tax=Sporosarcina sp. Marseille-Q4943 TaxID=2942204 RepID=UPI00208DBA12|nr:hypothetical protein [Sporosarcina sp. Marseille-Q4943]
MPNWDKIRNEWETTEITFKELAEKHGIKEGTLKSRRSREKWSRDATDAKDATEKSTGVATKTKDASTDDKKKTSSNGERKKQSNRSGNPNPKNQFTKRNRAAVTHGLFANFIQPEQQEIIDSMQTLTIADQLWMQIEIKFSAIIRMQKIMWVEDEWDHLDKRASYTSGLESSGESYAVVYAHERYEAYIKAQARAMAEYRNLVKQYIEFTDEFDERRLKLEAMQVGIDRTKAEIEKLNDNNDDDLIEIIISRKGDR